MGDRKQVEDWSQELEMIIYMRNVLTKDNIENYCPINNLPAIEKNHRTILPRLFNGFFHKKYYYKSKLSQRNQETLHKDRDYANLINNYKQHRK